MRNDRAAAAKSARRLTKKNKMVIVIVIMAIAALMPVGANATHGRSSASLAEQIDYLTHKERPGILTSAEIKSGRALGSYWFNHYPNGMPDWGDQAKSVVYRRFPNNPPKQEQYVLEIGLGYMTEVEAAFYHVEAR
jgi:hypothetical protein